MTAGQATLFVASVAAVAVAYTLGPLLPPEKRNPPTSVSSSQQSSLEFDYSAYRQETFKLNTAGAENASPLPEAVVTRFVDSMEAVIRAAFGQKETAEKQNIDSVWHTAGEKFSAILTSAPRIGKNFDNTLRLNSIYCYEKALALNAEFTDAQISLATAYMESQGSSEEVMKGVTLLRQITDKDPGNIAANLILGKYGIVSGQFDKAAQRFEKVLSVDSLNADAYLYLAQAYQSLGEKEKAISALEKCRSLVNDPDFANDITAYIEKLKNS